MLATINTILIVGATSGLGEQFARRLHSLGKKIIIAGRRKDRLASLKAELGSNTEYYQWDITDFATLTSRAARILEEHPDINSVFLVAGVGYMFDILDLSASTDASIITECNTNMTAQMLLSRIFVPHLSSVAANGQPATFLLMGAGFGYVPAGVFPVYSSTKAAIHALALALRQQVNKSNDRNIKNNLSIVEVVAPFVDTDFAKTFKTPRGMQPMPLDQYMDETIAQLEIVGADGKAIKEAAVGSAKMRADLWRSSIGKHMNDIGLDC
ncbi:putative oxidoreductase [Seiridium cardinale]|uniref:Oxidoreductase n=1 Tax=Seiridium cardinale TaxID=138064 RepID=A0ABR2XF61_9PEZI